MRNFKFRNPRLVIFILSLMLTATFVTVALAASQTLYLPLVFTGALPSQPVEPPDVYIPRNSTAYVDSYGYLHVVGEVQNNSEDYLQAIQIFVDFYTSDGTWLDTRAASTFIDNLPPHSSTCFDILLSEPAGWSYYEFWNPGYQTDGSPLPNLTVLNQTGTYNTIDGSYEITGEVRNDQGSLVEFVMPVGTLYNNDNIVIGCDFTFVDSVDLGPYESSSFEIYFVGRNYYDVNHYRVQVEGNTQ